MANSPAELWARHLIHVEEGRQFVDCKLLDEIIGTSLANKSADMEKIVEEMVAGTGLNPKDLVRKIAVRRQSKPSVCVAARTMQLILLRGMKKMPWNQARRELVEHFFPCDVLPYIDPFTPRKPCNDSHIDATRTESTAALAMRTSGPSTSAEPAATAATQRPFHFCRTCCYCCHQWSFRFWRTWSEER